MRGTTPPRVLHFSAFHNTITNAMHFWRESAFIKESGHLGFVGSMEEFLTLPIKLTHSVAKRNANNPA